MPFEPYVQLVDVTDEAALVAWGGFDLVEDAGRVRAVPAAETLGSRSRPHGDAVVEVLDEGGRVVARGETGDANHLWLHGLQPATTYRYRVAVDGRPWAAEGGLDWSPDGLRPAARGPALQLRTHPPATAAEPTTFLVVGDFGVGIDHPEHGADQLAVARTMQRLADARPVRFVVGLGDTIYHGPSGRMAHTGAQDEDWWLTFFQPYRYLLDHLPFYPTAGNHDGADTEASDDRAQLEDNLFLGERFRPREEVGRASLGPGLFYRVGVGALVELVCVDTTWGAERGRHWFDEPHHRAFLEDAFATGDVAWRIPFCHHPAWCAGPHHTGMAEQLDRLVPLYRRGGASVLLSGHEHNLQHNVVDGFHQIVSGAGGKLQVEPPSAFAEAGTRSWAAVPHCLLVEAHDDRLVITPYGATPPGGQPQPVARRTVDGGLVDEPITVWRLG